VRPLFLVTVFTAAILFAADRPVLNGTWQISNHEGKLKFDTLLIQQTPDGIKVTESGVKEKPLDISCGVEAQECKLKDGQISFWYNGPALVMMEMRHNNDVVTKTRVVPGTDGKTISLEVSHIAPPGSTSTYTFTKQQ
jgi:hypothetical protein